MYSRFKKTFQWSSDKIRLPDNWKQEVIQVAYHSGMVLCWYHLLSHYVATLTVCVGPSMLPTIDPRGELVLVDVFSYQYLKKEFKTGDVVIAVSPYNPGRTICKRIHAVGGETVVFRNKNQLRPKIVKVPDGHVWLLGDNQSNSHDSRNYGAVPTGLLVGKALFKFSLSNPFLAYQVEKANKNKITNQQQKKNDIQFTFDEELLMSMRNGNSDEKNLTINFDSANEDNMKDDALVVVQSVAKEEVVVNKADITIQLDSQQASDNETS